MYRSKGQTVSQNSGSRIWWLVIVMWVGFAVRGTESLRGPNVCMEKQQYNITKRIKYRAPMAVRTYEWCLAVPPRCSRWTTEIRDLTRLETEVRVAEVAVCCAGHKMKDGACVPACPSGRQGANCSQACPEDRWGPSCGEKCKCSVTGSCSPLTGQCVCLGGWKGESCELKILPSTTEKIKIIEDLNVVTTVKPIEHDSNDANKEIVLEKNITPKSAANEVTNNYTEIVQPPLLSNISIYSNTLTSSTSSNLHKVTTAVPHSTMPMLPNMSTNFQRFVTTSLPTMITTFQHFTTPRLLKVTTDFSTSIRSPETEATTEDPGLSTSVITLKSTVRGTKESSSSHVTQSVSNKGNITENQKTSSRMDPVSSTTMLPETEKMRVTKSEKINPLLSSPSHSFTPKEIWIKPAQKGDSILAESKSKAMLNIHESKLRNSTKNVVLHDTTTPKTIMVSIIPTSASHTTFKKITWTTAPFQQYNDQRRRNETYKSKYTPTASDSKIITVFNQMSTVKTVNLPFTDIKHLFAYTATRVPGKRSTYPDVVNSITVKNITQPKIQQFRNVPTTTNLISIPDINQITRRITTEAVNRIDSTTSQSVYNNPSKTKINEFIPTLKPHTVVATSNIARTFNQPYTTYSPEITEVYTNTVRPKYILRSTYRPIALSSPLDNKPIYSSTTTFVLLNTSASTKLIHDPISAARKNVQLEVRQNERTLPMKTKNESGIEQALTKLTTPSIGMQAVDNKNHSGQTNTVTPNEHTKLDEDENFHILTEPEHITAVADDRGTERNMDNLLSVLSIAGGVMMAVITVAVVIVMIERCRRARFDDVHKRDRIPMKAVSDDSEAPPPYVRSIRHTPLPDPPTQKCHYQPISTLDRNVKQFMRPVVVQTISPLMLENFRGILECHYDHLPPRSSRLVHENVPCNIRVSATPSLEDYSELRLSYSAMPEKNMPVSEFAIETLKCEGTLNHVESTTAEPLYAEIRNWRPTSEHAVEIVNLNGEAVTEL